MYKAKKLQTVPFYDCSLHVKSKTNTLNNLNSLDLLKNYKVRLESQNSSVNILHDHNKLKK